MSTIDKIPQTPHSGEQLSDVVLGPPTTPLPVLDPGMILGYDDRTHGRKRLAAAAGVALVAAAVVGVAAAHNESRIPGVAVAVGDQRPGAGQPPIGETTTPQSPEKNVLGASLCEIPPSTFSTWLLDPSFVHYNYSCEPVPSREQALFPLSGTVITSGRWTHSTSPIRQVDIQIADDRAVSGTSMFDNFGIEYPDSVVYSVGEYPARFISDLGDGARLDDPDLSGVPGTIIKVPNPDGEGHLAFTFAMAWGAGLGGDNQPIAEITQKISNAALGDLISRTGAGN